MEKKTKPGTWVRSIMKGRFTIQEKIKAFKLFQQIEKGKEFRIEISYSERYLKKIKQLFAKSTPRVK